MKHKNEMKKNINKQVEEFSSRELVTIPPSRLVNELNILQYHLVG